MSTSPIRRPRLVTTATRLVAGIGLAFGLVACGGGGDDSLSEIGRQGKETANSNGCASCHGANGQGGVGPSWIDLAGSEVPLQDGSTVIADRDYLVRSILDPDAEVVEGYTLPMPQNGLSEAQADTIVTYITELTSGDGTGESAEAQR